MSEPKDDFLSAGEFEAHADEAFTIHVGDQAIAVTLAEVRSLRGDTPRADRSPFSLLFEGPKDAALEQGIYRLEHEKMGSHELFIVTLGPDPDSGQMLYEIVFT